MDTSAVSSTLTTAATTVQNRVFFSEERQPNGLDEGSLEEAVAQRHAHILSPPTKAMYVGDTSADDTSHHSIQEHTSKGGEAFCKESEHSDSDVGISEGDEWQFRQRLDKASRLVCNASRRGRYTEARRRFRPSDAKDNKRFASPDVPAALEIDRPFEKKMMAFRTRTIWTVILICGFLVILAAGHFYCSLLIVAIAGGIYHEIISLYRKRENNMKLPLFFVLRWYWFSVTLGGIGMPWLIRRLPHLGTLGNFLLSYHSIVTFCAAFLGFVWFILSLRWYTLRYQFSQLAIMILTLIFVVLEALLYVANVYNGLIWFLLPSSLVIINDVSAYLCGLLFGRRRLIKLSPKKTVEGFLGASIVTMIWAVLITSYLQRYKVMVCPQEDIGFLPFSMWWSSDCALSRTFEPSMVYLPIWLSGWIPIHAFECTPMILHSLILGAFAAFCAPFGGFFASAFKRFLRIKDFGDSIPGHGGITDRFDCQILMGVFTYFYVVTFVSRETLVSPVTNVLNSIESLPTDEQIMLFETLRDLLLAKRVI